MTMHARRFATALAALTLVPVLTVILTAVPASAESSYEAGSALGLGPALLIFVGGPVAIFVLLWLLVAVRRLVARSDHEADLEWYREITADEDGGGDPALTSGSADRPRPIES